MAQVNAYIFNEIVYNSFSHIYDTRSENTMATNN